MFVSRTKNDAFAPPPKSQKELYDAFFARVESAVETNKGRDYIDRFLVPLEELVAVRDTIQRPTLFDK